jgi:hypothetical protein
VVINGIALCPSLVFNTPGAGGFGVGVAGALGESAEQMSVNATKNPKVFMI